MFKKTFIPIICILFIQSKLTNCFLPFLSGFQNEESIIQAPFEIIPRLTEAIYLKTVFISDQQEKQEENQYEDEYFVDLSNLEKNLNQEQENFIHKFILNDVQTTQMPIKQKEQEIQDEDSYIYIELDRSVNKQQADSLLKYVSSFSSIPLESFKDLSIKNNLVIFHIESKNTTASILVNKILKYQLRISKDQGFDVLSCGLVKNSEKIEFDDLKQSQQTKEILIIFGIVSIVAMITLLIIIFMIYVIKKRFLNQDGGVYLEKKGLDDEECLIDQSKKEDSKWLAYVPFVKSKKNAEQTPSQDYQDLCRQRMQSKVSPITNSNVCESINDTQTPAMPSPANNCQVVSNSNTINSTPIRITDNKVDQSRNSSWLEESMCQFNIDITTGHVILSYMEKYLNDKDLMDKDWKYLSDYEADQNSITIASQRKNYLKNRYQELLPYDFSLVKLRDAEENNYINASYIIDDAPKIPAYIAAQSPLQETASEFWQMIWENQTVVVVNLSNNMDSDKCFQYWPDKGSKIYNKYEIHFASEHVLNDDFLVRNFFFKNLQTDQTRTITQYQYLTWPESQVPLIKSFLDFRRKVNKSYTSKTCPILVHCNDGIGRTGTYILIDMVLNKISKGAKEIDLAATLEFLRDQRPKMLRYKSQYEFSFEVIIHEVKNYLNYLGN